MGEESLLYQMIARMSMAATLAFLLAQIKLFRRVSYQYAGVADKIKLAVIFGLIGIGGTYVGIPVDDALANSRVIGVMAAGLVGGPLVGLGAGLVAGGHRFFLGGFTSFSCALSSVVEGILAGWVKTHYPGRTIPWQVALLTGAAGEVLQMLIILLTASPWEQAMDLVKKIALPMTAANSIGIAVFMLIIKTIIDDQQRTGARQAQKVLHIATKTLPYFRRGMNQESAAAAAAIIYEYGGYDAAAVTNTERILAFAGAEAQHHLQQQHFTRATHQVIKSGEIYMARNAAAIGCAHDGCRLQSAIIVPLKSGVRVVGTIKLYYLASGRLNAADAVFAEGLAQLLSVQLELAELERQAAQTAEAELKALQAQINPHFLFNTLNTIISLVRLQPMVARDLLVRLSEIFRFTLQKSGKEITLAEEMAQVRAYLTIEKARYGDKINFAEQIRVNPETYLIQSLTLQPLVENAIKHGLRAKEEGGKIILSADEKPDWIEITVKDDGAGFSLTEQNPLTAPCEGHIGLRNVHERLRSQYGKSCGLAIESCPGAGTTVTIRIPKRIFMDGEKHVENFTCG